MVTVASTKIDDCAGGLSHLAACSSVLLGTLLWLLSLLISVKWQATFSISESMTRVMYWEDSTWIAHNPFDMHAWHAVCQFKVEALNFRLCFIFYKNLTRLVYYQHSIHLQNFLHLSWYALFPNKLIHWLLFINTNVANGYH